MTFEETIARTFRLDERTWARHANPWSVWTRNSALPVFALAVWSRSWIGIWSVVAVAAAAAWIWINPRIFPPPRTTDSWASRAVFGERIWMQRDKIPVPAHHRWTPHVLSGVAALGLPFVVWGLVALELWPLLLGATLIYAGKLWFLDRMVWLYQDMKDAHPEYRSWLY